MCFYYSDVDPPTLLHLQVIVSDNGSPALSSTATVVIQVLDANDNPPKFMEKRFDVKLPERRHDGGKQEVCRILAQDNDEGPNAAVTYSLQENVDEQFEIDPVTGVVTSHGDFLPESYNILTVGAAEIFTTASLLVPSTFHTADESEAVTNLLLTQRLLIG